MSEYAKELVGSINIHLVGNSKNLPLIELDIITADNIEEAVINAREARRIGYTLLGLASEADTQTAYIMSLRAHKIPEEEIANIIGEAATYIRAGRAI